MKTMDPFLYKKKWGLKGLTCHGYIILCDPDAVSRKS